MRLNKFIAEQLAIGRRQADYLIEKGRVEVNSQPAHLGQQVDPKSDVVVCDGKTLQANVALTYLMLNKPAGYVCSRKQQGDTPTIYSLLPDKYHHLKPVGRLDKDSSGLILLTNDGDFAHRMTHPSFVKTKKYEVTLNKSLEPLHQQMINDHGIQLDDGNSKFSVMPIEQRVTPGGAAPKNVFPREKILEADQAAGPASNNMYEVIMHEGRNRQIRRTFDALGYNVTKLHRTEFGSYRLDDLAKGLFKQL
jgi:pseudouridine synthase